MLCPDCPQLDAERMPEGWKPRARCCNEEAEHRKLSFRVGAEQENLSNASRQVRRRAARKDRRR